MHLSDGTINGQLSQVFTFVALVVGAVVVKKSFSNLLEKTKVSLPAVLTDTGQFFSASRSVDFYKLKSRAKNKILVIFIILPLILLAQAYDLFAINGHAGHFLGAGLAAIVLGPYLGMLVISSVLFIQALMFGDGGVSVIAVNIFNMAIVGCLAAYYFYHLFAKFFSKKDAAVYFAVLISVWLSALAYSAILFFSRQIDFNGLAAIMAVHLIIGLVEGAVTVVFIKLLNNLKINVPDQSAKNQKS